MKGHLSSKARKRREEPDRGNAPAEFVMVTGLVILFFALILQVAFAIYTRNILIDAASSGARYGALLDRTPSDGTQRTREMIEHNLPAHYITSIDYSETSSGGSDVLEIHVTGVLPVLGPFGFDRGIEVSGHALMQEHAQ